MAVGSLGVTPTTTSTSSQSNVSASDLFKILLTQLKYQDPLKPTNNAQFIAQLAQFTSLDQARQTNANMQSLIQLEAVNQSVGLIGKTVQVSSSSGSGSTVGQVTTISFNQGTPQLTVKASDGSELTGISPSQITTVR